MRDGGETISGLTKESNTQDVIERLKAVELLKPFFEEQVSKENGLDRSLLNGISDGLNDKDEQ